MRTRARAEGRGEGMRDSIGRKPGWDDIADGRALSRCTRARYRRSVAHRDVTQRSNSEPFAHARGVAACAALVAATLATSATHAAAQTTSQDGALGDATGWYDAAPLLASLRPAERAGAARAAGVERAEDLPLYELGIDLDLGAGVAAVREELWYTNREGVVLDELVLRIEANAVGEAARPGGAARMPVRFVGGRCLGGVLCAFEAPAADVVVVRPATPLAPGARLRVALELGVTLARIDAARTTLLAQGLEGLGAMGSPAARATTGSSRSATGSPASRTRTPCSRGGAADAGCARRRARSAISAATRSRTSARASASARACASPRRA